MTSPTHRLDSRGDDPRCRRCGARLWSSDAYCARCEEEMSAPLCPLRQVLADTFPGVVARWQGWQARRECASVKGYCRGFEPTIRTPKQDRKRQRQAVVDTLFWVTVLPVFLIVVALVWPVLCDFVDGLFVPRNVGVAIRNHGEGGWMKP